VQLLLEHGDDIIGLIQSLKEQQANSDNEIPRDRLSMLSKVLVPALQKLDSSSPGLPPSMQVATMAAVTKWTSADIKDTYPPLPKVLDPKLEAAALTHIGAQGVYMGTLNYERLEWVGDAYLELISTNLIHHTFPKLSAGRCAQLREIAVRNLTLSGFTSQYGLDKRATLPPEFYQAAKSATKTNKSLDIKILGDLFEAYVGAVIVSDPEHGVQRASDWLKALWAITLQEEIRREEKSSKSVARDDDNQKPPKDELDRLISCKAVKIEYRDVPNGGLKDRNLGFPMYTVGCFFTGWGDSNVQLGVGTALKKKEAGALAAQKALGNNKMIRLYSEKKKAFLAAREEGTH
jgi:ribonuclease III